MNDKNSILLVDPDFDFHNSNSCSLMIKVSTDNYSYAIIDTEAKRLVELCDHQECANPFEAFLKNVKGNTNLSHQFENVKASIYTPNTISIPNDIFDPNEVADYAKFFSVDQSDMLYSRQVEHLGFTNIFNLEDGLEKELLALFPNLTFLDHKEPALFSIEKSQEKTLSLDFTVGSVNCTYSSAGDLIFQNYYEIENEEEFNYYLLLMIKQLHLALELTTVSLSGIVHKDDNRYQVIQRYFANIEFTKLDSNQIESSILDDMPQHYYTSVLSLLSCE